MGAGGGQQSDQKTTTSTQLPTWERPFAKEYLASLAGLIFPGMTLPGNYIGPNSGYNFGNKSAPGGSSTGGGSPSVPPNISTPGLDTGLASNFLDPSLAGSRYLQNQNAQNPYATSGAASPAAFNQLSMLYPSLASGKKG